MGLLFNALKLFCFKKVMEDKLVITTVTRRCETVKEIIEISMKNQFTLQHDFLLLFLLFSVFIVDFEQVVVQWV